MHGNRRITPWMLASVPIVFILATSNLPTAPSSSCAISPSAIPASPSIPASPFSPATVTKRSPDANPQTDDSHFLTDLFHLVVSYGKQALARDRSPFRGRFPILAVAFLLCPRQITAHCPEQTPCASIRFVRRADQGILRFSFASLRGTQRTGRALLPQPNEQAQARV